jgi:hypothetical protein
MLHVARGASCLHGAISRRMLKLPTLAPLAGGTA